MKEIAVRKLVMLGILAGIIGVELAEMMHLRYEILNFLSILLDLLVGLSLFMEGLAEML